MTKVAGTISQLGVIGSVTQLGVKGSVTQLSMSGGVFESGWSWLDYWSTRYPSDLILTVDSATQITLNWTNNGVLTSSDSILIYRSTDGVNYTLINTALYSASSYINTGLTESTEYFYKLRYTRASTYSAYSNIEDATTESSMEAETAALIARAATAPSAALTALIDTTIKGLKDDGVFALGDALYVRGVHEAQLACQNWIKNAHNSTLVNSPTFTPKEGFKGNGSSQYIDNNFIPSGAVNLALESVTVAFMAKEIGTANTKLMFGASRTTPDERLYIYDYITANERLYAHSATYVGPVRAYPDNYVVYVRENGYIQGYLNGSPAGSNTANTSNAGVPTLSIFELAGNANGGAASHWDGELSFTFYGAKLTALQVAALYNRIKYFYDNVGGTF